MALKGSAVIELTDVKTGKKEIVKHDNLVTNAVNDILSIDPLNLRWETDVDFRTTVLPVISQLISGIVLFEDPLEEDPDKYFAPGSNNVIGYSNMAVSPSTDSKRGSLNQTESGNLEDGKGYRFVFDFATSQGNGEISALALTSGHMGACGYSSDVYSDKATSSDMSYWNGKNYAFRLVSKCVGNAATAFDSAIISSIVTIDSDNAVAYAVYATGAKSISVYKINLLHNKVGLFNSQPCIIGSPELIKEITTSNFHGTHNSSSNYNVVSFCDGGDGYIWGFSTSSNNTASSYTTLQWLKIKKEDWTFEEGTWTFPEPITVPGYIWATPGNGFSHKSLSVVDMGLAYFVCGDKKVLIIDTNNPTDITIIGIDKSFTPYTESNCNCRFNVLSDGIIYLPGAHIRNKEMFKGYYRQNNYYDPGLYNCSVPRVRDKNFTYGIIGGTGTGYSVAMYINNTYLATINNLDNPVQKTADKTMKITYILREEA